MVVQHNLTAMNSNRMLGVTTSAQAKSSEKLSSGYRINRAADDAAGLTISEKMRKQMRGLDRASTNAQDGVSAVQIAEGALTEVHSMLQRMNELANQASNGTNSTADRDAIQAEIDQLTTEIDRVSETTKFNETYLLKGDDGTKVETMSAHDAGLKGKLIDNTDGTAVFQMDKLDYGDTVTIGGKNYTIGRSNTELKNMIDTTTAGSVQIDGETYKWDTNGANIKDSEGAAVADVATLLGKIKGGSTVAIGGKTYTAMVDKKGGADGVDDVDSSIITEDKAYALAKAELLQANQIGDTLGSAKVDGQKTADDFAVGSTVATSVKGTDVTFKIGEDADVVQAAVAEKVKDKGDNVTAVTPAAGTALPKVGTIDVNGTKFYAYKAGANVIYDTTANKKYADANEYAGDKTWTDIETAIAAAAGKEVKFTPEGGTETTWDVADDTDLTGQSTITASKAAEVVNEAQGTTEKGSFRITKATAEVANTLSFNLHVGADADMTNKINVSIETMNSAYLGIKDINVSDKSGNSATYAIDAIADAISKVSSQRSALGAVQNRLEHTIANLDNVVENTTAAESRIRDTDMAEEMVNYSKNNILAQAGQSMLAQANQSNQGVLSLLQ